MDLRANSRDNPLYWSRPQRSTTVTSVELPAAYAALELQPAAMTWQAPGKAGTIAISNAVADAKLTITQAVELQPALLPADDYLDLLDANRALSHPRMKTVLARKAR